VTLCPALLWQKQHPRTDHFHQQNGQNFKEETVKCYLWSMTVCCGDKLTRRKIHQKHLESVEMWCCKRMEKIRWTDHVRTEEVYKNILPTSTILILYKWAHAPNIYHNLSLLYFRAYLLKHFNIFNVLTITYPSLYSYKRTTTHDWTGIL
jgi:hypothetical protein